MIEFYLIAVLIGLLVSLDDFKNGLIKNKYVVLLLLFGLVSKRLMLKILILYR